MVVANTITETSHTPDTVCAQSKLKVGIEKNDKFAQEEKGRHSVQPSAVIHTVRAELVEVRWHHPSTPLTMNGVYGY